MCFYIDTCSPKYKNSIIADKDIVCYKLLDLEEEHYESPYQSEFYFIENTKKKSVTKSTEFSCGYILDEINKGLHTYSNKKYAFSKLGNYSLPMVFKAIIPKGSEYYYNSERHEYVSTKLTVYTNPIKLR